MNVMDAIRTRCSVRKYDGRPLPDEALQRMKDALRLAPSACNNQPWQFVLVTEPELKRELARAAKRQDFIAGAPVIVVGVGLPDRAYKGMGGRGNSVDVDLAIALDHLTLAAVAEGLGTCWIGAFDEKSVARLINAPSGAKIVAMTPLGYPAKETLIHPVKEGQRKSEDEIFVNEKFP